jgi:anaerobic selenocysteine-containing dehydrogenase
MGDFSRRDFIKAGAGVAAASALGVGADGFVAEAQVQTWSRRTRPTRS